MLFFYIWLKTYQLSYPQWFTEICGNSHKHLSLLVQIPILSLLLQHEDERLVFFVPQSPVLRYQSFLCFFLSFLFGSQVKSHWSTVSKTWVWRKVSRLLINDQNHLFISSPWPSDINPGRVYSMKTPCRPRIHAFMQHNRKVTMLIIKSFASDTFSSFSHYSCSYSPFEKASVLNNNP